jgi:hypothetical protein
MGYQMGGSAVLFAIEHDGKPAQTHFRAAGVLLSLWAAMGT